MLAGESQVLASPRGPSVVLQVAEVLADAFANAADGAKACIRCDSAAGFLIMAFDSIVDVAVADGEAAQAGAVARGAPAAAAAVEFAQALQNGVRGPFGQVRPCLPLSRSRDRRDLRQDCRSNQYQGFPWLSLNNQW